MKDGRHRNVRALREIAHGRDLRLGLETRHKTTRNPSDDFPPIDESNEVSLWGRR